MFIDMSRVAVVRFDPRCESLPIPDRNRHDIATLDHHALHVVRNQSFSILQRCAGVLVDFKNQLGSKTASLALGCL